MGPYDPGGGRTHNLKIRSLTRYPITPQGHLRTPGIEPELEPWKGAVLRVLPQGWIEHPVFCLQNKRFTTKLLGLF